MDEDTLIDYFMPPPKTGDEWRKHPKWLAIKGISKHEIETFSGQVERGTPLRGKIEEVKPIGKVFTFGKYRGKTFDWVKANDSYYWNWAKENIKGFKE